MRSWIIVAVASVVIVGGAILLFGCSADISSTSRDIVTHCTTHTFGSEGKAAGTTQVEDCDISIDAKSKSKSSGF